EGEQVANGNLAGTYNLDNVDQGFTGTASASITARIPLHEGARFAVEMGEGSSFDAQVSNNRLSTATGTFTLFGKEGGEDVISATLGGTYNEGQGLTGDATLAVLTDILVAERGDFRLLIREGSGGTASVAENDLTRITGMVNLQLDHLGAPFAEGQFEVDYNVTDGANADISATGTVTLLGELEMGTVGEYTFTLTGGTGVSLTIASSELESLSGTVNVRIDDSEGEWVSVEITADYQHGAQPNLSGSGTATVLASRDVGTVG